jgi:lipid II:glycine glycyltransferase (peptidoglycan interpeptide bridge formation enzyme)
MNWLKTKELFSPFEINQEKINALRNKYSRVFVYSYQEKNMAGWEKKVRTTGVIDLKNKTTDEIFQNYKKVTRNEINKSAKIEGLEIILLDSSFETNYNFYKKFEYAQNRAPYRKSKFKDSLFFSAYLDGKIISHVVCDQIASAVMRIKYISSARLFFQDAEKIKICSYASRRVMHEAIKYSKEIGCEYFDFNGVNVNDPSKRGISDYKLSFACKLKNEYIYTYKKNFIVMLEKIALVKNYILKKIKM